LNKSLLAVHFAVCLFGAAALFGNLTAVSAQQIVFGRVFFAVIAIGLFCLIAGNSLQIKRNNIPLLILSGALLAFHWFAFFRSIQTANVAIALLSYSTFPIFTAFSEPLLLREKFNWNFIWLALLALVGIIILIPNANFSHPEFKSVFWGVLAGASFSFISVINRKISFSVNSVSIAFYMNLFAIIFLFPFLFFTKISFTPSTIMLLALLGVVFTALAHTLFIYGMKEISARKASLIALLEPVYGIILALFILNEIPDLKTIAGGVLILIAAIVKVRNQ